LEKENQPIVSARKAVKANRAEIKKNVLKRLTKALVENERPERQPKYEMIKPVNKTKPKHSTPQLDHLKTKPGLMNRSASFKPKYLFEDKEKDTSASSMNKGKPLINHELSKKLRTH
jgi:hypothetical protein